MFHTKILIYPFKVKFADNKHGVVEAITIADLTAWPSHDNNDRIDFGDSDAEVITTHFKDIRENDDVKVDDASTEWDMTKYNFHGRKVQAGQHNYEPYIINKIFVLFVCLFMNWVYI